MPFLQKFLLSEADCCSRLLKGKQCVDGMRGEGGDPGIKLAQPPTNLWLMNMFSSISLIWSILQFMVFMLQNFQHFLVLLKTFVGTFWLLSCRSIWHKSLATWWKLVGGSPSQSASQSSPQSASQLKMKHCSGFRIEASALCQQAAGRNHSIAAKNFIAYIPQPTTATRLKLWKFPPHCTLAHHIWHMTYGIWQTLI